jgi:hypothetical protein
MTERPRPARLWSDTVGWVRSDLPRAARIGGISFAVAWLFNFAVMTSRGASFADVMASTTSGNIGGGIVYWAVLSLTVSAVIAYGMEVGRASLWESFKALPSAVARMFREAGPLAWSLVAWGASVSLAISGLLAPTVSAALGIGLMGFAPTALMGILGRVLIALWAGLSGFFLPQAKPTGSGLGAQLVAVVGSAAGFVIASRASEVAFRLIAAAVLAVAANLLLASRPGRTTAVFWVALMGAAFWLAMDGVAAALGGCCGGEGHHGIKEGAEAMRFALIGGAAGGAGAVLGAGLGVALASSPPPNIATLSWDDPTAPAAPADPVADDGAGAAQTDAMQADAPEKLAPETETSDLQALRSDDASLGGDPAPDLSSSDTTPAGDTDPATGDLPDPPRPPPPTGGEGPTSMEPPPPPPEASDAGMEEAPLRKDATRPIGAGERDHIEEPEPPPPPDDLDDILPERIDLPPPEPG